MNHLDSFDARAESTVQHLRTLGRTAFLQYALAVGRHLIDTWFDGDLHLYRDRAAPQHAGFQLLLDRRKADFADLNLSAATLRNYMLADATWRELPPAVRDRLDLTHLYRLGTLVDPIARMKFAHQAAEQGWASRQLEEVLEAHRQAQTTGKGGRKALPDEVLAWRQVFTAVRKASDLPGDPKALPLGHRHVLRQEVEASIARLQDLHRKLVD